jgi:antitoxin (DNA-binding transcriptional repressor) of toxin-antitoxin stability system
LVKRASAGEEILIARGKTPLAKLVRADSEPQARRFGAMRGRARVTKAFFDPLPVEEFDAWNQ